MIIAVTRGISRYYKPVAYPLRLTLRCQNIFVQKHTAFHVAPLNSGNRLRSKDDNCTCLMNDKQNSVHTASYSYALVVLKSIF